MAPQGAFGGPVSKKIAPAACAIGAIFLDAGVAP